jgi:hypothetical protein
MRTLVSILMFTAVVALNSAIAQRGPDVLLLNRVALESAQKAFQATPQNISPAVKKLLKDAAKVLDTKPVSVMLKQQVPPSGDKHDFMSLAPYWWPDTTKPNGLPYIRRDGERNPEYETVGDNHNLDVMVNSVETLALSFAVTQDERYAQKAIHDLKVWFLDEATHMNPNLNYAQAVKGINDGRGIGIIETYSFRHLIDALILLQQSKEWTPAFDRDIRSWFKKYIEWLQESPNGRDESREKNNHGSAYDVQASCIALFLGQKEVARKIIAGVGATRIAIQVEPDGSQPLELARTKSWGYSNMNLDALLELAHLGDRVGVDLWHFKTPDGRSIQNAVDFLMPYAVGKKKWTYTQIVPFHPGRMYYALTVAAMKFKDIAYVDAANAVLDDDVRSSKVMFSIPSH